MNESYLLLGTNMGQRENHLDVALQLLKDNGISISLTSNVYETEAWGYTDQPLFLNQAVKILTPLTCVKLLDLILRIELEMGRIRTVKNASRIIDIDILFFNDDIISSTILIVPHPEIQNRRFVLIPMVEIAPNFIHPVFRSTIKELLINCKDTLTVNRLN